MPTITRWFNVTHDINADPEMWELRERFTDRAGFVWLECLSVADRNSGVIGPNCDQLFKTLACKCRLRANKVRTILEHCCNKGWTKLELSEHLVGTKLIQSECFIVAKWAKYNKTRDAKKLPSYPNPPNPPNLPNKNTAAQPDGFAEFWVLYPKKKSKGDAEKAWRKLSPSAEFLVLILAGVRRAKSSRQWLKQSGEFIPYPATWLRAKGWEDQEVITYSAPRAVPKREPEKKMTDEELARSQKLIEETIKGLSHKMGVK